MVRSRVLRNQKQNFENEGALKRIEAWFNKGHVDHIWRCFKECTRNVQETYISRCVISTFRVSLLFKVHLLIFIL